MCSAPDTCTCQPGWFDPNCTTPVCEQTCGNGGNCTSPNKCTCAKDWSGDDCREPVCEQDCYNGGVCIAPNTCMCPPDWSGYDCSAPVCHQGHFVPTTSAQEEIESSHLTWWLEYHPCNITSWCEDTHSFDCKQEKKAFENVTPLYGKRWRFVV